METHIIHNKNSEIIHTKNSQSQQYSHGTLFTIETQIQYNIQIKKAERD